MEDITQTDEFNEAMKDEFKHEPKLFGHVAEMPDVRIFTRMRKPPIAIEDEREKIIKDLTRRAKTFQFTVEAIRSILDKKF